MHERNARGVGSNLITRPAVTACLALGVGGLLGRLIEPLRGLPDTHLAAALAVLVVLGAVGWALVRGGYRNA